MENDAGAGTEGLPPSVAGVWQKPAGPGTSISPSMCLSMGGMLAERRQKSEVMYVHLQINELHTIIFRSTPLGR